MNDIVQKVYTHMKALSDQHGFAPTLRQTAEQLNLKISEVEDAVCELRQSGKIIVTDIPAKSIIEFADS